MVTLSLDIGGKQTSHITIQYFGGAYMWKKQDVNRASTHEFYVAVSSDLVDRARQAVCQNLARAWHAAILWGKRIDSRCWKLLHYKHLEFRRP